jgi:hypothetical protein
MTIHSSVLINTAEAAANVLGVTSTNGVAVTTMYFCNRTASTTAFNIYVVPAGFIANSNNTVYFNKTLAAGDTYVVDWEKLVLENGASIRGNANVGNAIVATVSVIGV